MDIYIFEPLEAMMHRWKVEQPHRSKSNCSGFDDGLNLKGSNSMEQPTIIGNSHGKMEIFVFKTLQITERSL